MLPAISWLRVGVVAGAAALAFAAGWAIQGWRGDVALSAAKQAHQQAIAKAAEASAKAEADMRVREQAWTERLGVIDEGLRKLAADLAADERRARAAAVGLHDAARRAASACASADAAATGLRSSAATAGAVLADVLQRADSAAGELAAALDRSHAAGIGCERAYDSLRAKP